MERAGLGIEQVCDVDVPYGDDTDAGVGGNEGGERVEVRLVAVSGDEDEFGDALGLPRGEQLVEGPVEGFLPQGCGSGIMAFATNIDAVVEGGSAEDREFLGQLEGDVPGDEHIAAEGQVWAVLFERADGNDESRRLSEVSGDVDPGELVECEAMAAVAVVLIHEPW